jgi:predicted NBD/HSP70 family sugar kinase
VGTALAAACTLLDPELVVVGGSTAAAGPLLPALRESLARGLRPGSRRGPEVVRGHLGARAEVLGAVALATAHAPQPVVPEPAAAVAAT